MASDDYLDMDLDVTSWADPQAMEAGVDVFEAVVLAIADEWLRTAQVDCPYITGRLYQSAQVGVPRTEVGGTRVHLGYEAPYARYVHDLSPLHAGWFANAGALVATVAERIAREQAGGPL